MRSFQLNIYRTLVWKRDTIGVTEEHKLVRKFSSSVVPQIIRFPKTKKSYTLRIFRPPPPPLQKKGFSGKMTAEQPQD